MNSIIESIQNDFNIMNTFINKLQIDFNIKNIRKKEKNINKIPKNIYQTFLSSNLPDEIKQIIDNNKKMCSDYNFIFYDDNDCELFIKNNFDENVYKAYMSINSVYGAMKADFFRYCILYKKGGIYLDIKFQCENNFKLIELTDKEYFVLDRPYAAHNINIKNELIMVNDKNYYKNNFKKIDVDFWKNKNIGLYNALMVCKSNNPILLECINSIVENVKNKNYDYNPIYVTGPGLLGEKYFKGDYSNIEKKIDLFNSLNGNYILNRNKKILSHYPEYRIEQQKYQKNEYYHVLWKKRKIYKE